MNYSRIFNLSAVVSGKNADIALGMEKIVSPLLLSLIGAI